MKRFLRFIIALFFLLPLESSAQYISTSETVPFVCPSVCAGGTLVLKIFQIQNLSPGAQVQAVLSNSTGGFGSGTTTISANRYSLSSSTGPWVNGPYTFSSNASNVFFEFTIPISATPASGYLVHFKSGATIGANIQMPCTGFTVTPSYSPLAAVASTLYGNGQWIAHAYTWTPTTGAQLNTAALVAAQNFFDPLNYKGHFLKNTLSFNLDYTPNGGKMPGPLTVLQDGTSFQCGDGYSTNFSLRLYRTENFAAGLYQFEIQGDDGIRFSIDGGLTWILNSFLEQAFAGSYKTTATLFPTGICLSGPTPLVIEYFQRPADAHLKFTSTLLSPAAIVPPKDSIVCAGQNAAFSTTSVAGASYQWQVSNNGGISFSNVPTTAPYSGSTSNSLQITASTVGLNASIYNCIVTGVCSNPIITANALLTVTSSAPNIISQPQNALVCDLGTATFTVGITGTSTFQWQRDSSGVFVNIQNGGAYLNVTGATLSISPATATMNNSNYKCIVTGCAISSPTNVVVLSVTPNASITAQPIPAIICAGSNASFSVAANNSISYQWQENTGAGFVSISNGGIYAGATSATLALNGASSTMNGNTYQCIVTGCSAGIISSSALLSVGATASINVQPIDNTLCLLGPGSFTIGVPAATTCQWQINTGTGFTNIINGSIYSGATTPSLQISGMQASMDMYQYRCIVSGCASSSVISNVVTLYLGSSAIISTQPSSINLCGPGNTSLTVAASNAQSFAWQVNNGSGFVSLVNNSVYSTTNTATLNITGATAALNGNQYQCVISSCSGNSVTSNAVTLTVSPLAVITNQPINQTVCAGGTATFSFTSTNAQSYTWKGGFGAPLTMLSSSGNISITNGTLVFSNVGIAQNNYQVNCTISDCSGNSTTSTVTLTVTSSVTIQNASGNQSICEGDNVNFSVTASNATAFQWQVNSGSGFQVITNGGLYSNSTSAALNITGASLALSNNQYRCILSGCNSSTATSSPSSLLVAPVSKLTAQTLSAILCEGANTSLSITTSGTAGYQWQVNAGAGFVNVTDGGIYSGATTSLLSLSNVGISENGNVYQCIYTSCGPSKISSPIPLTIISPPKIDVQPTNEKKCEEESAIFSILASGKNLLYHWQISSDGGLSFKDLANNTDYSNVNSALFTLNAVNSAMKNNLYRCAIDGGCNQTVFSDPVYIDVTENASTLYIPNAFTPNNDGLNDSFIISPYGLKEIKGAIFDRWGELIFEWNTLSTGWDGKYKGAALPVGFYVYIIDATSICGEKKFEKKGTVAIYK